ncbi:EAL domain-containing protein [Eubacteriaceae bacterium ES3]|nr:EAL domain-containing protein [Eubacteriaceae bacterium ES3]
MDLPLIYSLIFYVAFVGYTFFGFYILFKDNYRERKLAFFGICLTLAIWSFSFSIANSADSLEIAMFWRRFAVIGWGGMYAFLLHFVLIITDRAKALRKMPLLLLIYLPAMLIIFLFALYEPTAVHQHHLFLTPSGWVNIPENNIFDQFFNVYYIGCSILSLMLLLLAGIRESGKKRKAMFLVFSTFLLALILGSVTDTVINTISREVAPQMAPAIILIPVSAILFSIMQYDFIDLDKKTVQAKEGEILNEKTQQKIYHYLMLAYLIGANTNFVSGYFLWNFSFWMAMATSLILAGLGIALLLINHSKLKDTDKDMLLITILAVTIPYLIIYYRDYGAVTVWAAPVVFIILLIPFRNEKYLLFLGGSYLLSLVALWIIRPSIYVEIVAMDHLDRIIFVSLFLFMAIYINQVFLKRLRENEEQIHLQKMISEISTDLINISENNRHEKIENLLRRCGEFLETDRLSLFFIDENEMVEKVHHWYRKTDSQAITIPLWRRADLQADQILAVADASANNMELPQEIKSFYAVPVCGEQKPGVLQAEYLNQMVHWGDSQYNSVKIVSNLLIDALNKLQSEAKIKNLAYYDGLTGLPNRTLFHEHLVREIYSASRSHKAVGVVFLDIDGFKTINDTLGHNAGDELLIEVGQRLRKRVRKNDLVCRFGGDEFLVMLSGIHRSGDIDQVLSHLMTVFTSPMEIRGQELFITASLGVSLYPNDGEDPDSLIKNADLSMYYSKDQGKNRITCCSPVLKEDQKLKTRLTNDLYRAIENDELELFYQPQISLKTMKINGIEALIRWNHPELGLLTPNAFIPLAMKHPGLMKPIDQWVIETACRQMKGWQEQGYEALTMAVNLSCEQLENPGLIKIIKASLSSNGLEPDQLELEITESLAFKNDERTAKIIGELKSIGINMAIDDFGVEYSSLNRIKNIPFDRIKMDITFIREIDENPKNRPIANTIIQLAKILKIKVLAEGVETETQLAFLKESGCDEVQGYYFYRPMPAEELSKHLQKKNFRTEQISTASLKEELVLY